MDTPPVVRQRSNRAVASSRTPTSRKVLGQEPKANESNVGYFDGLVERGIETMRLARTRA